MLWWLADDNRLSGPARGAIAGAEELLAEGFALLPITTAHASASRRLPYVELGGKRQRDPLDRLLVAQAETEKVPLVSRDPGSPPMAFRRSGDPAQSRRPDLNRGPLHYERDI